MDQIEALRKKAQLNLLKKQQVCTDTILKDFNYKLSMPLEYSHVQKSTATLIHNAELAIDEKDVIKKDVRAPQIELTFDLQKDIHANNQNDPQMQSVIDESYKVNFNKVQLQNFFEQLEKVQLKLDELNS